MSIPFLRDDPVKPGEAVPVAPGVRRILCDNPGPFTWRGTNTWLIGQGRVAVLDPGPADAAQLAAILRATEGETITHILVSHTHRDHSPGVAALQAATGARSHGFGPHLTPPDQGGEGGDHSFTPDVRLADGAVVEGDEFRLTAIHTPGHCANHLCFARDDGVVFSADHVMSWSTTVVSPPDGDMAAYMASLSKLAAQDASLYLPGHGPPLPNPAPFVAALAAHRLEREAKVLDALRAARRATALALVPPVYGPVLEPRLVPAAARSLLAHLLKLVAEGQAARDGESFEPR
ncbi:MBL fold metallo-hydrolase [Falsiroseomonas selenitidurans]|uniref:MBL fold metallo-hydrolase n=1 Tax=Falsiroseomonas selenitidurans TaxID=2716335 RepID=A0ABX1E8U6_9PROT|nr:MBL fold metallo-hydrolase [Falsiroseomonas selenitidurans]NKC31927.1 MBL fold metallo-hydrolase [Falsiroseomonas selenitidurans]